MSKYGQGIGGMQPIMQQPGMAQQQVMPFQGMGRPVSAGQGFAAQMPQANAQAFHGSPGLLSMALQNQMPSNIPSTTQFVQSQPVARRGLFSVMSQPSAPATNENYGS